MANKASLTIDTWQASRGEGLANLHRITPNAMVVNAQDVFPVNHQARDYALHELPTMERLLRHPALSSVVVMNAKGNVALEHYAQGNDRNSTFSCMSSTKSMGYILLNHALVAGKVSLNDKVEQHIAEIGSGFRGRTVGDVASMAVKHTVDETAAYVGEPAAMEMYERDERVIGFQRNDERETLREFISAIEAAGESGSNEWSDEYVNYATINTGVLGLILENATGQSLAAQVRELLHEVGGENPVYMGTDFEGTPVMGASFLMSTIDFARYGRLLITDKAQVAKDQQVAQEQGKVVPADLTYIDGYYYKSVMLNKFGLGHSGWGGQLVWADPQSDTVVVMNSQIASELAVPYEYFQMQYQAAYEIVEHFRQQSEKA